MVRNLLLFCFLALSKQVIGQPWERIYLDPPGSAFIPTVYDYNDSLGGLILRSLAYPRSHRLSRVNISGDTIWNKRISLSPFGSYAWSPVTVTRINNKIFLGGYGDSVANNYPFYFMAELDTNGNVANLFKYKNYAAHSYDAIFSRSIVGSLYSVNSSDPINGSSTKIISKFNSNGSFLWKKTLSTVGSYFGFNDFHATLDDGSIYGLYYESGLSTLTKRDQFGNVNWTVNAPDVMPSVPNAMYSFYNIICTRDNNFTVHGYQILPWGRKSYLLKFNQGGVLIDSISFPLNLELTSGTQLKSGKILMGYALFGIPLPTTGFMLCDSSYNNVTYYSNVLNTNGNYYGFKLIPNKIGGAFCAWGEGQAFHAANFDSLFNTYPYKVNSEIVLDNNQNCNYEITDKKIMDGVTQITDQANNNFYAFSDTAGVYRITLPLNTYTITHTSPGYKQYECPGTGQFSFSTVGSPSFSCAFFDTIIPNVRDFNLMLANSWFGSNDTTSFQAYCFNDGTTVSSGTLTIKTDSCMQFISSTPSPLSIIGNTITYLISNIQPDSSAYIQMCFNTALFQPIWSTVNMNGYINCVGDVNLINNNDTLSGQVWPGANRSAVPNTAITNNLIVTQPLYINGSKELVYKIQFQNINDETIKNLVIVDSLSNNLDMSTFRVLYAKNPKFKCEWWPGNKIIFRYNDINIPSSSVSDFNSRGEIVYGIKAKLNMDAGTEIKNNASLFFDYHEIITTQRTKNILRKNPVLIKETKIRSLNIVTVYPNPASDFLNVESEYLLKRCQIFDVHGKLIMENEQPQNKLNIQNLSSGLYILKIYTENSVSNFKLLVD